MHEARGASCGILFSVRMRMPDSRGRQQNSAQAAGGRPRIRSLPHVATPGAGKFALACAPGSPRGNIPGFSTIPGSAGVPRCPRQMPGAKKSVYCSPVRGMQLIWSLPDGVPSPPEGTRRASESDAVSFTGRTSGSVTSSIAPKAIVVPLLPSLAM